MIDNVNRCHAWYSGELSFRPDAQKICESRDIFQARLDSMYRKKRGNGLKFVRGVINGNRSRGLLFLSGSGKTVFGGMAFRLNEVMVSLAKGGAKGEGTFVLILWRQS